MPLFAAPATSNSPLFLFFPHLPLPALPYASLTSLNYFPSKASQPLCTPRGPSLCYVSHSDSVTSETAESGSYKSPAAVAAVIRRSSQTSSVEFTQRVERFGENDLILPSSDFQRLCIEQLDLFRAVVDPRAVLSVYVRPPGSYIKDQLELHRIIFYPGMEMPGNKECVIIIGNFAMPGGLHAAEVAILREEVDVVAEFGAIVFPLVKHRFVVGFLVAELPKTKIANCAACGTEARESLGLKEELDRSYGMPTSEKRLRAVMISRSLATAYVMDQKSMLLRQTSWQNNARMGHLVEQIHGSLSSIKALSKMLSLHVKRSEIAFDIVEDIVVQGDSMKDAIRQLQDAVRLTKANIIKFGEDSSKKKPNSITERPDFSRPLLSSLQSFFPLGSKKEDIEVPMPPLLLAPLQDHTIRSCSASEILIDLVRAASALASMQQRSLELCEIPGPLLVAVDESALRQALSNLIEGALLRTPVGDKVQICGVTAPAGGALIVIDDNGPDMHYMTQMHALTPFGADLLSSGAVEDSMTWNFIAGLAVAREILESYGCVTRIVSPRKQDAALGTGGTRIELWLPDANSS